MSQEELPLEQRVAALEAGLKVCLDMLEAQNTGYMAMLAHLMDKKE
jgi:hypothetical protein